MISEWFQVSLINHVCQDFKFIQQKLKLNFEKRPIVEIYLKL